MIDAFVLTEDTPGAVFRDLFLSFFCEDAGAKERREERSGASLPRTWKEQGDVLRSQLLAREAELKEQGFPEAGFRPPPLIKGINDFLRYVHRVTGQMHNLRGRTVVYLNPTKVTDKRAFLTAIQHALETGLPDNQILMVHAPPEDLAHQMLGPRDDLGVVTIEADLDMGAVAEELAADGDPGDPALRYRTLFVELNRHGQARNYGKMREAGDLALAVADQTPGWEHLSVTILAAQGSHLLTDRSRQEEALAFFVRARRAAEVAVQTENPSGPAVMLQARQFEAAGLVHLKRWQEAAECYEAALDWVGEEPDQAFQRFETLRMAGWCHQQAGNYETAWDRYQQSLVVADLIPNDLARNSTLPYVGRELLRLADRLRRLLETPVIRERMDALVGPDWEEVLAEAERKSDAR